MLFNLFNKKDKTTAKNSSNSYESNSVTPSFTVYAGDGEIPELQGDFAKAVFLWAVSKSGPVKGPNEYSRYITYACGIRNPQAYHESMIHEGYLEEDSMDKALMYLKLPELKELALELGVSGSGKKAEIIKKILSVADTDFVYDHCPATFSLSDKGQAFIEEHDAYVQLHRHNVWGINWKEYDAAHRFDESFEETIARILTSRAQKDTRLFGRIEYLNLYQLMHEAGEEKKALFYLLQVLYIDLSGVCGIPYYESYKQGWDTKKELENNFECCVTLAPGILEPISKFSSYYTDAIVDRLFTWKLPVQICDIGLFKEIVHSSLDGSFDKDTITAKLRSRFRSYISKL